MTTASTPTTSAEAIIMLVGLQDKRAGHQRKIDAGTARRADLATQAEFVSNAAQTALRKIDEDEATARAAIRNLDVVIGVMEGTRDKLQRQETAAREGRNIAELNATIDGLLALDDEIDATLDHARELLARREEYKRENAVILRRQPGKDRLSMIGRESEVAESILAYFDTSLNGLNAGRTYTTITRVADHDSRYYKRQSAAQIARGPRPLTAIERALRRQTEPAPMQDRRSAHG